ncbi:MAG: hypothetical protein OEZ43_13910 [Gammaproteobacteria bacterium]|nr:hypothetical protein [Gammaproteobacteria bacterium]
MKIAPIQFTGRLSTILVLIWLTTAFSLVQAQEMDHSPLRLPATNMDHSEHMGDKATDSSDSSHKYHAGAWMFAYSYERMFQRDMLDGNNFLDPTAILNNSPLYTKDRTYLNGAQPITNSGKNMIMDMHMLMLMYNQTSRLSWEVMLNYLYNNMTMYDQMSQTGILTEFPMTTRGVGDTQVFLNYTFARTNWFDFTIKTGINLPTGSIDNSDGIFDTMTQGYGIAPYIMQTGTGTYDIHTALQIERDENNLTAGAKVYRISRTGYNRAYYNRGDVVELSTWLRYRFASGTQLRSKVMQTVRGRVEGRDDRMTDNTRYTGGSRLDVQLGIGQQFSGFNIHADYAIPVRQYLNGPQMKTNGILQVSLEYMMM